MTPKQGAEPREHHAEVFTEGPSGAPPRGRDRIAGVYVGDLNDLPNYVARLLGREGAFGRAFFDEKYRWVDPFGYDGTPYDDLRGAVVRYALSGGPHRKVCEVGAGEGFLARRYADLADDVTLIDLSERALRRARRQIDRPGEDLVGDAIEGLRRVDSGCLDAVVIAEVLYYLSPNPFSRYGRSLRAEVLRVTRPGGRVVLLHPFGPILHAAYHASGSLRVRERVRISTTRSLEMLSFERR